MAVHFTKWDPHHKLLSKTKRLYEAAGTFDAIGKGDLVAIKFHIGELGNPGYIQPFFIHQIFEAVKERGGKPFLTDSTTLYRGQRNNAVDLLNNAFIHGFSFAPFIPADGLRGDHGVMVKTKGIFKEIEVAEAIADADAMILVSHSKGHVLAGYGGAIKNLAMGCTTKKAKLAQHRAIDISVDLAKCTGCGVCADVCPFDVPIIEGEGKNKKTRIESDICTRCIICKVKCPQKAIKLNDVSNISRALASAAYGVLSTFKPKKVACVNFAKDITAHCDCVAAPGMPIHDDLGIYASDSVLSIDSAVLERIGKKLNEVNEGADCFLQVDEAEKLGFAGERRPKVIDVN